ncbi:MAG: hypothetical protein EXS36_00485 [Pedosphaera sp.]|nr:hypothetical protein [Pedosphaera sp.]
MKFVRKLHLYLGVFFAPLLLFYIGSGWYQTVNPARLKSAAEAESLAQKFRVVHTDQIYPGGGDVRRQSPKAFQVLVVAMSVAMIVSTLLGLILAFKFTRTRWPVWLALGLGTAAPILLLMLGQRR